MLTTSITTCARCGESHLVVELKPLARPLLYQSLPIATHWAPCPTNGEPILINAIYRQTDEKK